MRAVLRWGRVFGWQLACPAVQSFDNARLSLGNHDQTAMTVDDIEGSAGELDWVLPVARKRLVPKAQQVVVTVTTCISWAGWVLTQESSERRRVPP